ncbi:MAG TPA: HAD-IIA family hydrolase [Vicinamibacteria bacterium]|nr:HAD-IIA family hydrolase [Vicinamibacteria bacterium]
MSIGDRRDPPPQPGSAGTTSSPPSRWDGLIVDIDGTLLVHDRAVPGAAAFLASCARRGLPYRIVTNTTRRSRAATTAALRRAGLDVDEASVLQPAVLARRLILDSGRLRAGLLVPEDVRADLAGIEEDEHAPDWVVLGDVGRRFDFESLNRAFRWLRGGARLLALHRNPCWQPSAEEEWVLDAGAFVAALEYAAGVTAEVVGKPSPAFFRLALRDMGLEASRVLVVGDDVESDGRGGAAAGCRTALVKTGRFRGTEEDLGGFAPDLVVESVADLVG